MYRESNQVLLSFRYLNYYRLHLFSTEIKGEKNRYPIVPPKTCLRDLTELVRIIIDSPPLLPHFVRAFFASFSTSFSPLYFLYFAALAPPYFYYRTPLAHYLLSFFLPFLFSSLLPSFSLFFPPPSITCCTLSLNYPKYSSYLDS